MNKTQFYQSVKDFHSINVDEHVLDKLIEKYPYFVLARLKKNILNKKDISLLSCLFPDRKHLYSLINKETIPTTEEKIAEETYIEDNLEQKLSNKTSEKKESLDLQSILQQRLNELNKTSINSKEIKERTITQEAEKENTEDNMSLDELIEKFNTNCPKISSTFEDSEEDETYEDLCKSSVAEKMNFVTETLANIYIEQKKYDKAIKIYKTLMTRYPEKSGNFATLIEELKQIKNSQQI
ncbi:MAG: tetratricopeptide repeat protein [Bacteroidales bacterium]|jgi:predicted Zn-dependent protease|nr:tetratricopeptide repeat protein [Bacteroidales bacterium]MDD2686932.1 tetratricopeptide repeat protein [Bacteroidales bacterium]MDD3330099.1 tetratricopeptide repeat protein [Bacteroidales bacterium]MDD3690890.1 tetratricopeptide repeat protein [Bacteroidales bacterium]MDD4044690.1 tetratricopeptide repeat protein [Bacteroidales bacterium]